MCVHSPVSCLLLSILVIILGLMHSPFHLSNTYLLSTHCIPGTMLTTRDTESNKTKSLTLSQSTISVMQRNRKNTTRQGFEVCTGAVGEQGKGISETLLGEDR